MILAALAAATAFTGCAGQAVTINQTGGITAGCVMSVVQGREVEMEACGGDANRPDVVVCVAGKERRVRLVLPDPPCGTPEAAAAGRCTPWTSPSTKSARR